MDYYEDLKELKEIMASAEKKQQNVYYPNLHKEDDEIEAVFEEGNEIRIFWYGGDESGELFLKDVEEDMERLSDIVDSVYINDKPYDIEWRNEPDEEEEDQ